MKEWYFTPLCTPAPLLTSGNRPILHGSYGLKAVLA